MRRVTATIVACIVSYSFSFVAVAQPPIEETPAAQPSAQLTPAAEQTAIVVPASASPSPPRPEGYRIPEAPPRRTWMLSVGGAAGSGTVSIDEDDLGPASGFEEVTVERKFFFGMLSGFAGLVVAKNAWGHIEHGLGYQLNVGMGKDDLLHSHNLAYFMDTPWLGFGFGMGVGVHHPFEGDYEQTKAGFNVTLRLYGYVAGSVFIAIHSNFCAFEESDFSSGGLMLGIANR